MADLTDCGLDPENGGKFGGFEPLPAGEYLCVIESTQKKATKLNTGYYLEFKFQVAQGPKKGRYLFTRLNLWNNSTKAVEIARAEAEAIFKAIGITNPRSSEEAHGMLLSIEVKVKDENRGPENKIVAYRSRSEATAAKSANKPVSDEDIPF